MIVDGPSFPQCWCMPWYVNAVNVNRAVSRLLVDWLASSIDIPRTFNQQHPKTPPKCGPHSCDGNTGPQSTPLVAKRWTISPRVHLTPSHFESKFWTNCLKLLTCHTSPSGEVFGFRTRQPPTICGKATILKRHFSDVCLTKSHPASVSSQGGQTNHHSCLAPPGRLDRA